MKSVLSFLATILLSCIMLGPAVAQQRSPGDTLPSPRGVEGPEIRKETPKGTGEVDTSKPMKKKGTLAREQNPKDTASPPRGVEGPEMRKQVPKGSGGVDTPKPKKKGTRARGEKPRYTDTPPKVNAEPEIKQDSEKKIQ